MSPPSYLVNSPVSDLLLLLFSDSEVHACSLFHSGTCHLGQLESVFPHHSHSSLAQKKLFFPWWGGGRVMFGISSGSQGVKLALVRVSLLQ